MAITPERCLWVDAADLEVRRIEIGGLPVLNAVLDRLGFEQLVASALGSPIPAARSLQPG
jgi:hypothetical protein